MYRLVGNNLKISGLIHNELIDKLFCWYFQSYSSWVSEKLRRITQSGGHFEFPELK